MVKYDSYKDSGIEWVGKIPKHWILNKVGNNTYVKGRIGWKGLRSEDFIDEGPYLITGTDFNTDGSINWDKMYHVCQERYDEDPFIQLNDHDVLITKDGTIGKVVYVGELKGQTCLNSGIFLTRPLINEYLPKYFYWVLNSNVFKVFVDYNSGGSTIQHLYQNVFVNFKIPLPSIPEQHQIVQYLETKTTLIDTLIQKTQEKIDLLREKRTSLINHTVTKGLNPHVEMKESGVEWIGKIPKHWNLTKIKYFLNGIIDTEHKTVPFHSDGQYYVIRTPNIRNGRIVLDDIKMTNEDGFNEWTVRGVPKPNDVLLTREGPVGECCVVPENLNLCLGQRVVWLQINIGLLNPNYLIHTIYSSHSKVFMDTLSVGSTLSHLNISEIGNIPILICSLSEQQQIVEYIDEQTQLIDTLIQKEEIRVGLLKEYRQSLISDVVTGKIKVTDHE